jgi:DNA repair exonuclease SbcCD ATPase subunit
MGLLRKKRHNRLKEQLLNEGKLDQFRGKFSRQIKLLDDKKSKLDEQARKAYEAKEDYETRILIHQINELKKVKQNIQALLATLEKADLQRDSQNIYQEFIEQLESFQKSFKDNSGKKRKDRKALKKYKKEASSVSDHFDWIDKKVERIDRALDKKENITEKSLNMIDVDAYFNADE